VIIALGGSSNLVNQASIWWGYEHFIGHRSKLGIPISKWSTLKLCETLWSLLRLKFWLPKLGFHDNSKIAYSVLYLIGGLEHVLFFHNIWDVILPIDFHIFQRGWNHQPGSCHIRYIFCHFPTGFAQKRPVPSAPTWRCLCRPPWWCGPSGGPSRRNDPIPSGYVKIAIENHHF